MPIHRSVFRRLPLLAEHVDADTRMCGQSLLSEPQEQIVIDCHCRFRTVVVMLAQHIAKPQANCLLSYCRCYYFASGFRPQWGHGIVGASFSTRAA